MDEQSKDGWFLVILLALIAAAGIALWAFRHGWRL